MMKRVGSRQEVYQGVAERTSGGMRKEDIMIKNNKFISRKKSDRMRIMVSQDDRLQAFRSNKKTKCNNILKRQENTNNYRKTNNKRTQKKVIFHFNRNKVQEYNCPDLNYYRGDKQDDEDDEEDDEESGEDDANSKQINFDKKPRKFKIEKITDIDIDDLF
jgi:hypothetical protein